MRSLPFQRDPVTLQIFILVRLVLGALVYAARVQDRPAARLVRIEAGDEHFSESHRAAVIQSLREHP